MLPDVAGPATNTETFDSQGTLLVNSGTSIAAPVWAGFMARANEFGTTSGVPSVGFFNPLLYVMGQSPLYPALFNDILSGSNGGFSAVTGYDLVTGWGSPQCTLVGQLGTLTPLTPMTRFDSVVVRIGTGGDDLRANSDASVDIFASDNVTKIVSGFSLKANGAPAWGNGYAFESTIPLGTTVLANGLGNIVLKLGQHFVFPDTPDNWNVESFNASLNAAGADSSLCLADVVGSPADRLTQAVPSATFPAGEGCPNVSGAPPPGTFELTVHTGNDNLRSDSEVRVAMFQAGSSVPIGMQTIHASGAGDWLQDTHTFLIPRFAAGAFDTMTVTLIEHDVFPETDDNWDLEAVHLTTFSSNGPNQFCLVGAFGTLSSPAARLTGSAGTATFQGVVCP